MTETLAERTVRLLSYSLCTGDKREECAACAERIATIHEVWDALGGVGDPPLARRGSAPGHAALEDAA